MSHRVFICCCKGFFRDENSDELYQNLGVERRATAVEIKRAYRNKSLQMHPDKLNQRGQEVTEQDRADFQKMKGAYDVLSDPQKRELYDQLGETGMLMMEDPFAAKDNMIKNFLRMGTRDRLRLVIFVLLFVGAVLLWPILFCVKVDGDTSAKWVALWTPLWIYDALGLWYFIDLVSMGEIKPPEGVEEGWKDPSPLPLRVLALVKWILLVLFQIFLTMRLDEYITWSYATVGCPLLVWIGLQLFGHIYEATRPIPVDRADESMLNEEEGGIPPDADKREQAIAKRSAARTEMFKDCVWIMQLIFLIIELDDKVDWSWWVVFLPTWILLFTQLISYCIDCSLAKGLAAGMEGKGEDDLTQEEKTRMMAASQLFANAMTSCCCWSFTFVTVVLAVNAMAGADYSAFVIFIPQFSIAGILVCCMTCFICCVRAPGDEDTDLDGNPISEQEAGITAPQHTETSYGTYTPPAVPGGGRKVASAASPPPMGASSSTGASSAAVIAMPLPPPPVASTAGAGGAGVAGGGWAGGAVSSPSDPPAIIVGGPMGSASPAVASTPAPENQADGGID